MDVLVARTLGNWVGSASDLSWMVTVAPGTRAPSARLDLRSVSCRLGATAALDAVDLVVEPGSRVAVIGPNGAGKSTLLRAVLGLVRATGIITVDGVQATDRRGWRERRHRVAWVPQRPAVGRFPLLARELLASSGAPEMAREIAEGLGVGTLHERALHTLSGGQLQRVYLARGLAHVACGATLLLADEPTSALDFATRDAVADVLTRSPVTTLVVTHDAEIADRSDVVVEMAAGQLREVRR